FLVKGMLSMSQRDPVIDMNSRRESLTRLYCVPRYVRATLVLADICSLCFIIATMLTGLEMSRESAVSQNATTIIGPVIASVFCGCAIVVQVFAWKASRR